MIKYLTYIPIIGIIIFCGLYIWATQIYPGGSTVYPETVGFDWVHNYWCDLMGSKAKNGIENPAALLSKMALIILSVSLMFFFWLFPRFIKISTIWNKLIRFCGVASMIIGIFIFTALHDIVIILSGLLALIALIGIFRGLSVQRLRFHLWFGVFALVLMALNNFIYFLSDNLTYLPLLQKITFAIVLIWVVSINWIFIQKSKLENY